MTITLFVAPQALLMQLPFVGPLVYVPMQSAAAWLLDLLLRQQPAMGEVAVPDHLPYASHHAPTKPPPMNLVQGYPSSAEQGQQQCAPSSPYASHHAPTKPPPMPPVQQFPCSAEQGAQQHAPTYPQVPQYQQQYPTVQPSAPPLPVSQGGIGQDSSQWRTGS